MKILCKVCKVDSWPLLLFKTYRGSKETTGKVQKLFFEIDSHKKLVATILQLCVTLQSRDRYR